MTDASLDGVQNNPREPKHDPAMSYQADRRSDRHNLPLIAFSPFPNSLRLSNPNEYLVNRNRTPLRELVDPSNPSHQVNDPRPGGSGTASSRALTSLAIHVRI